MKPLLSNKGKREMLGFSQKHNFMAGRKWC